VRSTASCRPSGVRGLWITAGEFQNARRYSKFLVIFERVFNIFLTKAEALSLVSQALRLKLRAGDEVSRRRQGIGGGKCCADREPMSQPLRNYTFWVLWS
jgi:hypothetical protein